MPLDPLSVPFLRSCERCRQKKRKCSGEKPVCTWCREHSLSCHYRRTARFKKQLENHPGGLSIGELTASTALSGTSSDSWRRPNIPESSTSGIVPGLAQVPPAGLQDSNVLLSADALARLFSVDMVPTSNPLPPNLLQMANSYMSPFVSTAPLTQPEWLRMPNMEANMLANLGSLATSGLVDLSQGWVPMGVSDFQEGGTGRTNKDLFSDELFLPFAVGTDLSTLGLGDSLSPLSVSQQGGSTANNPSLAAGAQPTPIDVSGSRAEALWQAAMPATDNLPASMGSSFLQPGLPKSAVQAGIDLSQMQQAGIDLSQVQQAGIAAFNATPHLFTGSSQRLTPLLSSKELQPVAPSHSHEASLAAKSPTDDSAGCILGPGTNSVAEPTIPPVLKEYVSAIPGTPSPEAIYRIMRETFKAPRMGMVSLNLELIWFMLHKGVLPRIVFYGHLASTVRCSAANIDVNTMVPPNIDESCYELALREIPHIKDCAAIWGAIGICMVARYEFQSARYTEMSIHADMAMDVVRRITFTGCSYPWHDVSAEAKESFGFQYLLAIFWKVFLWKLMAVMLVDRDLAFPHCLEVLPDYSSKSFDLYTADQSYSVDLIEMLPPNSWLGADVSRRPNIMFSGPNDPEFMRRPEGSPYFNRESMAGAYTQQMLVVFARFLAMLGHIKLGSIGLRQLLKGLWVFKERMNMLRYTLPPELMLVHGIMEEYLDIIKPASRASLREIDLKASRLKDVIMLHLMYHTFLIRANRLAMKLMLGESLDVPPPNVDTAAFAIRDLYDSKTPPQNVRDSLGHMNIYFQGCRIEAIKSANALCSIIQMAYECRFNFYTLGSPIIFTVFELLAVHSSFLRNRDRNIVWRAKSRLSNIFNICRTLRHWAPALNMFVAGIKLLSDPALCLEESSDSNSFQREDMDPVLLRMSASSVDSDATSDDENTAGLPPKRRRIDGLHHTIASTGDARANVLKPTATHAIPVPTTVVKRDETLSYKAADPIPEFPNPLPPTHVISLIIKDLGVSLAEFLAPAYPILLLKLIPSRGSDSKQAWPFNAPLSQRAAPADY